MQDVTVDHWFSTCGSGYVQTVCAIEYKCQVSGLFALLQPKRSGTSVVDHLAAGSQQVCEQMKLLSIIYFLL